MAKDVKNKKNRIMSLFFEETPIQETESASVQTTPVPSNLHVSAPQPELDKDIYAQLMKILYDNNIEGYDYFEFRSSLENMKNVLPAECDRFKATFAAVSSIVSVEKLTSSADFYLSKLAEKKKEFDGYVQQVIDAKVTAKEEDANKIKATITEKTQQIAKINEEINKLQEISVVKLNDAVTERAKIETVKNNFNATFNKVVSDIESDKNKINSYLTQGK